MSKNDIYCGYVDVVADEIPVAGRTHTRSLLPIAFFVFFSVGFSESMRSESPSHYIEHRGLWDDWTIGSDFEGITKENRGKGMRLSHSTSRPRDLELSHYRLIPHTLDLHPLYNPTYT